MPETIDYTKLFSRQAGAINPPSLRAITPRIEAVGGVNLGQGTCQLPVPEELLELSQKALRDGFNRYSHPRGLPELRQALASKLARHNNLEVDPETQVMVTCGSTGGFEALCSLMIEPGDEVVVFTPYYPYHVNTLNRFGAVVKAVKLRSPDWAFELEEFKAAVSDKTKFVVVNTPGNPTGKVFSKEELLSIGAVLEGSSTCIITDEIYEYLVYEGRKHISPGSLPELAPRTITLGGYSKTFSITGWRIGFMAVPEVLSEPITQLLDSIYICPPTPLQKAVADAVESFPDSFYTKLCEKYQAKRDVVVGGLRAGGFNISDVQGSYYVVAEYPEKYSSEAPESFLTRLIEEVGVAGVPASDFLPTNEPWLRFCYSVPDEQLSVAVERLSTL